MYYTGIDLSSPIGNLITTGDGEIKPKYTQHTGKDWKQLAEKMREMCHQV